jgi:hypothetical protein
MGTAAWFSCGVFGLTPYTPDTAAVALLPPIWLWPLLAAAGAVITIRAATLSPTVAALPTLAILPWLGLRGAPALIWSGPAVVLLWLFVGIAAVPFQFRIERARAAGALTAVVIAAFELISSGKVVTGDEPHYLLITRSLQRDGDFDLRNDYELSRHQDF